MNSPVPPYSLRKRPIKAQIVSGHSPSDDQSKNGTEFSDIEMPIKRTWYFLLIGLLFHTLYIWSIFDIYFRSPLVIGLPNVEPVKPAPAKRLVLFVADGLRADTCFQHDAFGRPRSPFIREMARTKGTWGVSHTRVPTESRPGHIAMIAGFYEDVSAVTQGWKRNTTPFDHTLKQATKAWSFGAPEIVDLFQGDHVTHAHYDESMIDFAKEALEMDKWSFDQFHALLDRAQSDPDLKNDLNREGVVIFLHLLGLDTNGHAFGPHSPQYHENTAYVDRKVKEAVEAIEAFYGDDQTVFIFTSDHGMSDAGSHGDGHPTCTRCPFVAWGAGVRNTSKSPSPLEVAGVPEVDEAYMRYWKMGDIPRKDINQADITPLMATLIGIPIPSNNEGVLPTVYLDNSEEFRTKAALNNLQQLVTTLLAKEQSRKEKEPFFQPFPPVYNAISTIKRLITEDNLAEAMSLIDETRNQVFSGLQYYQKYDWLFLRTVVVLGYVGWMLYALLFLCQQSMTQTQPSTLSLAKSLLLSIPFVFVAAGWSTFLSVKGAPWQYFAYCTFPTLFGFMAAREIAIHGFSHLVAVANPIHNGAALLLYAFGLELFVLCFFEPSILAILTTVCGAAACLWLPHSRMADKALLVAGFMGAGSFSLFEPIKTAKPFLLPAGTVLFFISALAALFVMEKKGTARYFTLFSMISISLVSVFVVLHSDRSFAQKTGLPLLNQMVAWTVLACSLAMPLLFSAKNTPLQRVFFIVVSLAPAYVILSISYEMLFYCFFCAPLLYWIGLRETESPKLRKEANESPIARRNIFLAFSFLVYLLLAFFGTGNFASISSFTLPSTYRLVTRFAPFLMATLLIIKILIPIVIVAAAFGVLFRLHGIANPLAIFFLVMATFDLVTLNFFFLVRDYGSWLDIGTSISHFIIASVFSIVILLVYGGSKVLLRGTVYESAAKSQ